MAHRAAKCPRVSVVLSVHDGADTLVRAVDSVLNQAFEDFELLIADCASSERTDSICARYVDRDIRVEYLPCDSPNILVGRDRALEHARGRYALIMDGADWLGPGFLGVMVTYADEHDLQVVVPARSEDMYGADGERTSRVAGVEAGAWTDPVGLRGIAASLIDEGAVSHSAGSLYRMDRIFDQGLRFATGRDGGAFAASFLATADRVGMAGEAGCYHATKGPLAPSVTDREAYARSERDHARVLDFLSAWGTSDPASVRAAHARHLRHLVECIAIACTQKSLSSIERRERVHDMLVAPSTRASVDALKGGIGRTGLMFEAIARESVMACCVGACLKSVMHDARHPFSFLAATGR